MITKRLTAPLSGKVKVPENCFYTTLLKFPFEALISAKHVLIANKFMKNVPLTKMLKIGDSVKQLYEICAVNLT